MSCPSSPRRTIGLSEIGFFSEMPTSPVTFRRSLIRCGLSNTGAIEATLDAERPPPILGVILIGPLIPPLPIPPAGKALAGARPASRQTAHPTSLTLSFDMALTLPSPGEFQSATVSMTKLQASLAPRGGREPWAVLGLDAVLARRRAHGSRRPTYYDSR